MLIGVFANFNKSFVDVLFSKPIFIWFIWIGYALFNTFILHDFNNHRGQSPFVFISAILITFIFYIVVVSNKYNSDKVLKLLVWAYFIRMILTYAFDSIANIGDSSTEVRLGADFNSNSIANGALFLYILLLFKRVRLKSFEVIDIIMLVLSILTIFLAASKKVFISMFIFSLGYFYVHRSKSLFKKHF